MPCSKSTNMNGDLSNKEFINKELRRLSRTELLELMVEQSRELDKTREELALVKEQLSAAEYKYRELEEKYAQREIRLQKAGSIAEASLALTSIFEEAQKAAEIYLQNIHHAAVREGEGSVNTSPDPGIDDRHHHRKRAARKPSHEGEAND